jgi:hypothetical protein
MSNFTINQRVRVVNAQWGNTYATVTGFDGVYVLARLDEGGPEYTYNPEQLTDASGNVSGIADGDVVEQAPTPKATHEPETSPTPKKTYLCLECGATYNKIDQCPVCDSRERIYNV